MPLTLIQQELKAPKVKYNDFGNYQYRSTEDILAALKPVMKKYHGSVNLSDELVELAGKVYVKATASMISYWPEGEGGDVEQNVATAYAQEAAQQKGMNTPQLTLSASSFARKQALQGLLAIDDSYEPAIEQGEDVKVFDINDIKNLLKETSADLEAFYKAMKVKQVEDLSGAGIIKAGNLLTRKLEKMNDSA